MTGPQGIRPLDPRDAINYGTPAPIGVPVESGDVLAIIYSTYHADQTLILQCQIQLQTGEIIVWAQKLLTTSGYNITQAWAATPGILISATIWNSTYADVGFAVHVQVHLHKGGVANGPMRALLVSGYLDSISVLCYPTTPATTPLGQPERHRLLTLAAPAAGVQYAQQTTSFQWARIRQARINLVTDATVATRDVYLQIRDSNTIIIAIASFQTTQPASTNYTYTFARDLTYKAAGSPRYPNDRLPDFLIPPNGTFQFLIGNIAAGDQLSTADIMIDYLMTT